MLGLLKKEEEKKKNAKSRFFTSHGAYVNCAIISDVIHSFDRKSAIEYDGGV